MSMCVFFILLISFLSIINFLFCFFFFKQKAAYDVRISDWSSDVCSSDLIDELLARRIGGAFVAVTGAGSVVVGHDMRPSSPGLAQAFAQGATQAGADVVMIGLASTDQLYFASGNLDQRSEERRVGKECGRTCRSGWLPNH